MHSDCIHIFLPAEHTIERKEHKVHQVICIRQAEPGLGGNFKKTEVTEMAEMYRRTTLTGKSSTKRYLLQKLQPARITGRNRNLRK